MRRWNIRGRKAWAGGILTLVLALTGCTSSNSSSSASSGGGQCYVAKWQHQGYLTAGIAAASPHTFKDPLTGKWSGIAVDVLNAWAQTMSGVQVRYVDTSWDNIIAGLDSGKWDIAVSTTRTAKRALSVVFTDPYFSDRATIIVRANAPVNSLADIDAAGIKIAVPSGAVQDTVLTAYATKNHLTKMQIIRLPSFQEDILAFESGRVDALFLDLLGNRAYHALHPTTTRIIEPNPPLNVSGSAFSMRQDACFSDIAAFNQQTEDMVNNGQLDDIINSYLNKT
jgi:polar amino acid transport system substrate-binding protein